MRNALLLAGVLALNGCDEQPTSNQAGNDVASTSPAPSTPARRGQPVVPAPNAPPRPLDTPTADHLVVPATTPPLLPEPKVVDPKSAEAAVQVVKRYGALLEERKFAAARKLWGEEGEASGLPQAQYVAAYDKYAVIHAEVGAAGNSEGAAGSIYVDVPLRLYGTLKTGKPFNLVGPVSLRRVNDVDGATPAQLRWHIFQSGLKPRP